MAANTAVQEHQVVDGTQIRHPVRRQAGPVPRDTYVLEPNRVGGFHDASDLGGRERPEYELLARFDLLADDLSTAHYRGPGNWRDGGQRMPEDPESLLEVLARVCLLAGAEAHALSTPL